MSRRPTVIAVSVSEANDLGILGFLPNELDRVLAALITPLVHSRFRIAYGGRLEGCGNFTTQISGLVAETYAPYAYDLGERPFIHVLAPHRVAALARESLLAHAKVLGPHAELWLISRGDSVGLTVGLETQSLQGTTVVGMRCKLVSSDRSGGEKPTLGSEYSGRGVFLANEKQLTETLAPLAREAAGSVASDQGTGPSFSRMRRAMAQMTDARILVGGRTEGFSGHISGVTEEALSTIDADKPLLILGAFGGAARDIAIALRLMEGKMTHSLDQRYIGGIERVREREPRYREIMRRAGVAEIAVQLAAADTHSSAARLATRILQHLFRKPR